MIAFMERVSDSNGNTPVKASSELFREAIRVQVSEVAFFWHMIASRVFIGTERIHPAALLC